MIEPIEEEQKRSVLQRNEFFVCEAERIFNRQFDRLPVLFDLHGSTAGMYKVLGKRRWIRYNPWIFAKYYEVNLADTVPHEVAHYIIDDVYGRRAKAHGMEWKALMNRFGADPGVTFNLDLSDIPRRQQRTHAYNCLCRSHEVSSTRHNRVMRGRGIYHCRECDGELVFAG